MRGLRHLPRNYVAFVLVSVGGPLLVMLAQGDRLHPSVGGLAVVALLLYGLARGSVLAWTLLLMWNLFLALAIAGADSGGGQILWSGPILLVVSLVSVALLLSSSMRRHVRVSRGARAPGAP